METTNDHTLTAINAAGRRVVIDSACGAQAREVLGSFLRVCCTLFDNQGYHSYKITPPPAILPSPKSGGTPGRDDKPEKWETIHATHTASGSEVHIQVRHDGPQWYVRQTCSDWLSSKRPFGPLPTSGHALQVAKQWHDAFTARAPLFSQETAPVDQAASMRP